MTMTGSGGEGFMAMLVVFKGIRIANMNEPGAGMCGFSALGGVGFHHGPGESARQLPWSGFAFAFAFASSGFRQLAGTGRHLILVNRSCLAQNAPNRRFS